VNSRGADWAGVALVTLCAALAALIEALLVPLYAGTVVVPVAVLLTLVGNVALPRMARTLVPTTFASAVPLLAWLLVMFLFLYGRPEGDVAFPSRPGAVEWVFYGTLFGGVLAGIVAVVAGMPPPATKPTPTKRPGRPVSR
jgi:hypothetical protein